uniref:Tyrosine-protein phosphatase auxilin n=1 Tax=Drosophila rhopaloa TaxID=1041015 RepID=A0A6P4FJI7_DRORH
MKTEKVHITKWSNGKDIRSLLCSLQTVLWQNANWQPLMMSTLNTLVEVKKAYRHACVAVHPDKNNGTENEEIAKLIFIELNNAWTDFEKNPTALDEFGLVRNWC